MPVANVIGSIVFFALIKPKIEQWQVSKSQLGQARRDFICETRELANSTSTSGKRQELGILIMMLTHIESQMVVRFHRHVASVSVLLIASICLDLVFSHVSTEQWQTWLFHANVLINFVLLLFVYWRYHSLDEELSNLEEEVLLSYIDKSFERLTAEKN